MKNSLASFEPNLEENIYSPGKAIIEKSNKIDVIKNSEEIEDEFSGNADVEFFDVAGKAIVPGFIDTHTHLLWGGDRSKEIRYRMEGKSYAEIENMGGGITHTTFETRNATIEELNELGYVRLRNALSHGTTHIEAKSGYGLDSETELKLLQCGGMLSEQSHLPTLEHTWLGAHSFPKEMSPTEYVEHLVNEQLPAVIEQSIAHSADVFCEPGWFTVEQSEDILRAAKKEGLRLRMHIDEFQISGGADLAADLGVDTADHAYHTPLDSRMLMKQASVNTGFLPAAPYVLGQEFHDYSEAMEHEIPFTLASDFNPNCQFLSIPMIGSFAIQRSKLHPLMGLKCVTTQAAKFSNLPNDSDDGSIREGNTATFNILHSTNWENWCQTPGTSPIHSTCLNGNHIIH
ncbi:MAG: imidazolonepropionase [Candidatus Poseidoniales archaeon]